MNARVRSFVAGVVAAAALVVAPTAEARDVIVPSFDGAPISASFFPAQGLAPGQKAPTILETHGWGAVRDEDENSSTLAPFGQVGLGPLRRAGFNVLTWDSRGFGESGGTVEVDSKDFEGRDVSVLLDWLATQPEQQLDAAGDPRAGMTGASYAGGIELVSAGITAASTPSRRRSPGTRCSPPSIATTSSRAAGLRRSRGSAFPRRPRSGSSARRASRREPSTRTSHPR
jgi:pimeloyl-ACP methyl ester carboxylesterase